MDSASASAPLTFSSFAFDPLIQKAIDTAGYTTPTPIQKKAMPDVISGKDVLGLAQTGTGKTAAFVLPILQRLLAGDRGRIRALVVVPTRELAEQVCSVFRQLASNTKLGTCTVYGGASFENQRKNLHGQCDIVVACPGRLLDHINRKTIQLSRLEVLVLDEADQMFDMGFLPSIRSIFKALPKQKQTLMFSATMPKEIRKLAEEMLHSPAFVQADPGGPAKTVSHTLYSVQQGNKTDLVLDLLKDCGEGSVLVFTRTKHRAKRLALNIIKAGFKATCLQGNLSQNRREEAMSGFRKGKYQIMVATDIAARGIDISSVSHVINFDVPSTVEAYTHRIGRTGRAAQTGSAITFVSSEDESMVRSIKRVVPVEFAKSASLRAHPAQAAAR